MHEKEKIMVKWVLFDRMDECCAEDVARLLPLVGEKRREKALQYKHVFGQWTCLKACELLCGLLRAEGLWQGEVLPDFEYTEYGKPFLRGLPDFSISHCREAVAVAVVLPDDMGGDIMAEEGVCEGAVGMDVESVRAANGSLIERVMNEREREMIRSAERQDEMFTRLWTQKEAVVKCKGTGIISELKDVLTEHEGEVLPKLTTWTGGGGRYAVSIAESRKQ